MDPQENLFALIEAAENQQKAAAAAITALKNERAALSTAIESLKNASGTLQKAAGDAAGQAVTKSLDKSLQTAEKAANRSIELLDTATDKVRAAGTWISFKIAAAVALVGALAIGAVYGIGQYMVSSTLQEITALRAEKIELQANVDDLAKRGGRAKLNNCGGRLCIEASTNQGEGYDGWVTPWKAKNGANLVILRGY